MELDPLIPIRPPTSECCDTDMKCRG